MEDLAEQWSNFSLSEREKTGFVLNKDHRTGEFIIATLFLTPRFLNMEAMARTFKQLWRSTNGFKIRNHQDHRVLFVFDNLNDIDRILQSQPWSFDKHLVMVQRYNTDVPVQDLSFTKALFWVQVHEIPVRYMTKKIVENLCETVGEVQKLVDAVDDEGGHFIRVRVSVDVTLPLCRGQLITMENGTKHWIRFKYERLPNLCFWCGRLTHSDKNCDLWIESKGTLSLDQQQYSSSLKAAPYSAKGKNVIFVPGFYEGRTTSVRVSKEVNPSPALVGENSGAESSENSQSDREVTLEGRRNKFKETINVETVGLEDTLQTDSALMLNGKSVSNVSCPYSNQISGENNINSEILFPKPVSSAELFEIQIKEIDEALFKFGKHTAGEINTIETINANISAQSQCKDEGKGSGTLEIGPAHAREKLKGSVGAPAQPVQQNFNTTTPKKRVPEGAGNYRFMQGWRRKKLQKK